MYYSTFAHLDRQFELPTHDVTTPTRRRGSRRGLRGRISEELRLGTPGYLRATHGYQPCD